MADIVLKCPKCGNVMKQVPNRLWYWVCTKCGEVVNGFVPTIE